MQIFFVLEGAARENFFWSRVDRWRAGVGVWEDKAVGWERVSGLIFFLSDSGKAKEGARNLVARVCCVVFSLDFIFMWMARGRGVVC